MIRQIHIWSFNDWVLGRILDGFTDEEWWTRPGGTNPAIWILGHILMERKVLGKILGADLASDLAPDATDRLFEPGTKPDDLPRDLDGRALVEAFHATHRRFVEHLEGLDEAALEQSMDPLFPTVPPTRLGALQFLLMHESYHIGQLSTLRMMLGRTSWMESP